MKQVIFIFLTWVKLIQYNLYLILLTLIISTKSLADWIAKLLIFYFLPDRRVFLFTFRTCYILLFKIVSIAYAPLVKFCKESKFLKSRNTLTLLKLCALFVTKCAFHSILLLSRPLRVLLRFLMLICSVIRAFVLISIHDISCAIRVARSFITTETTYFFKNPIVWMICLVPITWAVGPLTAGELGYHHLKKLARLVSDIPVWNTEAHVVPHIGVGLVYTVAILIISSQYAGAFSAASYAKRPLFSSYYLSLYALFALIWLIPEFSIFKFTYFYMSGWILVICVIFRFLREDSRLSKSILFDPFKIRGNPYAFLTKRHISVLYSFRDRIHSPSTELIIALGLSCLLGVVLLDTRELYLIENGGPISITLAPSGVLFVFLMFFALRQSTYPKILWLLAFVYPFVWCLVGAFLLFSSDFSFFGLITHTTINETSALSSVGLISTLTGIESMIFNLDGWNIPWYYGESLNLEHKRADELFDTYQFVLAPYKMGGDMYLPPHMLTPHDDHNWTINTTYENSYFNSHRYQITKSDSLQADVVRYWPLERNLHIWFGEFLEKDLYYGWSHRTIVDTESFFDNSPYALSNILGDGFTSKFLVEVLNLFVGAREYDTSDEQTLDDWGHSYGPGASIREQWSYSTENKTAVLDAGQRSRINGEGYHEWFPGIFVLDGRFDVKQPVVFIRIFIICIILCLSYGIWSAVNDIKPFSIIETFGENDMSNYNFFLFGTNQTETLASFYWSKITTSTFEWPIDQFSDDQGPFDSLSMLPSEELFQTITPNNYDASILDSYFYVPVLKSIEGYNAYDYKKFMMPILFPVSGKSLWASNVAREVNFEYPTLFETVYNNMMGFGDYYPRPSIEYDGTQITGSDDSSTGDDNPTESNDAFDDTIIDAPATETQGDWTDPDFYMEEFYYADYLDGRLDTDDSNSHNLDELWSTRYIRIKLENIKMNLRRPFLFHGGYFYKKKKIELNKFIPTIRSVEDPVVQNTNRLHAQPIHNKLKMNHKYKKTEPIVWTDTQKGLLRYDIISDQLLPLTSMSTPDVHYVNKPNMPLFTMTLSRINLNYEYTFSIWAKYYGLVDKKYITDKGDSRVVVGQYLPINSNIFFKKSLLDGSSYKDLIITLPSQITKQNIIFKRRYLSMLSLIFNFYSIRAPALGWIFRNRTIYNKGIDNTFDYRAIYVSVPFRIRLKKIVLKFNRFMRKTIKIKTIKIKKRRRSKRVTLIYRKDIFKLWSRPRLKLLKISNNLMDVGLLHRNLRRSSKIYKSTLVLASIFIYTTYGSSAMDNKLVGYRGGKNLNQRFLRDLKPQLVYRIGHLVWMIIRNRKKKSKSHYDISTIRSVWQNNILKHSALNNYFLTLWLHGLPKQLKSKLVGNYLPSMVGSIGPLLGAQKFYTSSVVVKLDTLYTLIFSLVWPKTLIIKNKYMHHRNTLAVRAVGRISPVRENTPEVYMFRWWVDNTWYTTTPGKTSSIALYRKKDSLPSVLVTIPSIDLRDLKIKNHYVPKWYALIGYEPKLRIVYDNVIRGIKLDPNSKVVIVRPNKKKQSRIKTIHETVQDMRGEFFKRKIDNADTTTESSSSTEDTESSDDTESEETYAYNWETYLDERYTEMGAEETDEINIFDYLEFIPFFSEGHWAGSDSEGTVIERNATTLYTPKRKYKVFSGVFMINTHLYEGALYTSGPGSKYLSVFERYINPFVSDAEVRFYDDKIITFRNLPLLWVEFTRHLFINRWRLQYEYSSQNNDSSASSRYFSAFMHEYYHFKFKSYVRFLSSIVNNIQIKTPPIQTKFGNSIRPTLGKKRSNSNWKVLRGCMCEKLLQNKITPPHPTSIKVTLNPYDKPKIRHLRGFTRIIRAKLKYVRNKVTSRLKETSGMVFYKRPYRVPVDVYDQKTKKKLMFNTKNAWYRFIYMVDYFDEESWEDPKFIKINPYYRMDANLRFKRNWFFSNVMFEDRELMSTRGSSWIFEYDTIDLDRKRSRYRNLRHASHLRLNFNSELWWTKWDRSGHGFRRIDDMADGILDPYGPSIHLLPGLRNVAFPEEDPEIYETTLPLFEKSILDPESPALNEDGEFAEFDENINFDIEYKEAPIPDHLMPSDIENFDMWQQAEIITNDRIIMKKLGFGSPIKNSSIESEHDFNPTDYGDLVDNLSNKSVHPISYSSDFIYDDNIDQKLEEAILHYSLTGKPYDMLFYSHGDMVNKVEVLDWNDLDVMDWSIWDHDENEIGIGYDLTLLHTSPSFWSTVLEADSNWEDLYQSVYPQIHDTVENMYEYLPVWNYDPALWEATGMQYSHTPLIINDDSKALINLKISRFDTSYNWLSSKALTQKEVSMENNSWGGSHTLTGYNDQIEFDFFYDDEDVDSDVDIDVENLYLIPGGFAQNIFEDEDDTEDGLDRVSESDLLEYYRDTEIEPDEKDADEIDDSRVRAYSKSDFDSAFEMPSYILEKKEKTDTAKFKFFNDHEWMDYADSDETTNGSAAIDDDSRGALTSDDEEDEFYFDTAEPDAWDVSIHFLDGMENNEYSFIDWGQENEDIDGDTDNTDTALVQNYPSTEGVYQDYMENDYANIGRLYPEEINFMLQDEQYDELVSELEITDLPDSVEISELESVDSEFSISHFDDSVLNVTDTSPLYTTVELTAESSTDMATHTTDDNLAFFDFFDAEPAQIGWRANYVSPVANPEIDIIDPAPGIAARPKLEFEDRHTSYAYQAERMSEIFSTGWGDSSPIELEDTTRETESFFRLQKYIDSYRAEAIFDEILYSITAYRNMGIEFNFFELKKDKLWQKSMKNYLFTRTQYLAHYRCIMIDIGAEAYMF